MLFHYALNSLLVFILLVGIIELFLFLFRVHNPRVRYICRLLPILKLPFDYIVFETYGESLFVNFNPFSCELQLQQFLMNLVPGWIDPQTEYAAHVILPQYLSRYIPSFWMSMLSAFIIITSLVVLARKVYLFVQSRNYFRDVLKTASSCTRPIFNPELNVRLKESRVHLLTSPEVGIPFAAYLHYILLPTDLVEELSQDEFEAIVVHELEHLRWKDPVLKMLTGVVCAIFWWLPSREWLKQLEEEQEEACDLEICKYGIDTHALASAMVKVIKNAKYVECHYSAICPFGTPKTHHLHRLEKILYSARSSSRHLLNLRSLFGFVMCIFAFICFWAC
jgi:beta-lactamase regulating signal transducer with metallopeptidase domain